MPRPKKSTGAKHWYGDGKALSDNQKSRLFEDFLGFDFEEDEDKARAERVAWHLEYYLGTYAEMEKSTDKAPTDAVYRAELKNLRKQAYVLLEELRVSYWMRDLYTSYNYDLHDLEQELARFFDLSTKIQREKNEDSRGRPPKRAITMLVNTLYQIFQQNYQIKEITEDEIIENDAHDKRKKDGRQQALIWFIEECLKIAKIDYPSNVTNLIYTADTPENERLYISRIG